MRLADLNPNPDNPRKVTNAQLAGLNSSLKKFGDLSGFIFNRRTENLVGGHQRQKVLPANSQVNITEIKRTKTGTVAVGWVQVGDERYPYREVDWDEQTEKAATIAANKHGGDWDLPKLTKWTKELKAAKWKMPLLGFPDDKKSSKTKQNMVLIVQCPGCKCRFEKDSGKIVEGLAGKAT